MKRRLVVVVLVIQFILSVSCSFAEEIMPRADIVFADANAILYSGKYVIFTASTYDIADSVSVTSVQLEQKVNGKWSFVANLTCPPSQTSCIRYASTVDYTSEISTGTYRVVATFCADGHSITRPSNERTFSKK